MKKYIFIGLFVLACSICKAQIFKYKANIEIIDTSMYYSIYLSPEITSKLNHKFSDIRIYDSQDNEIPYLLKNEIVDNLYQTMQAMKIVENNHKISKKHTVIKIENIYELDINNISLVIENTDAEKWFNISGSEDDKNWDIIKNNTRYQSEFSDSATASLNIRDLPTTNYKFYKILVYDYNNEKIKVLKIYNYQTLDLNREFSEIQKPHFKQDDSSEINKTVVHISFPEDQYVDRFDFEISKPRYYLRKAELVNIDTSSGKKIRLDYYDSRQQEFYLNSDSVNQILLSRYKIKNLQLVIYNNDNAPLEIANITAYQQKEYIIAFLNKNEQYTLKFGNINLPAPVYDLKFFKDQIPVNTTKITTDKPIEIYDANLKNKFNIYVKPQYLWGAFIFVLILLGIIAFQTLRKK